MGTDQVEEPELQGTSYEVVEIHSVGPVQAVLVVASAVVALGAAVAMVADVQVLSALEKVKVNDHEGAASGEASTAAAKSAGMAA